VVVLVVSVRFCYFFRGNLQLGALTHTFFNIIIDILPMLAFLGVIIFGFTFALMILIMHELDNTYYGQWHSIDKALYVVLNMGLYAQTDPVAVKIERSSTVLLLLYQLFMFVVQVIVLNMLIAIMADSHSRVTKQSALVAQHGRAQLILEYETLELSRLRQRAKRAGRLSGAWAAGVKQVSGAITLDFARLQGQERQRLEIVCPKWLHVLMPADNDETKEGGLDATEEQKQIHRLRK